MIRSAVAGVAAVAAAARRGRCGGGRRGRRRRRPARRRPPRAAARSERAATSSTRRAACTSSTTRRRTSSADVAGSENAEADDGEGVVAVEVGDVLAAEAVDVAHRGRASTARAERLLAQQDAGVGVVVVHVGGDAVAVGEHGIDVGAGGRRRRRPSPSRRSRRPSGSPGRRGGSSGSRRTRRSRRRPGRGSATTAIAAACSVVGHRRGVADQRDAAAGQRVGGAVDVGARSPRAGWPGGRRRGCGCARRAPRSRTAGRRASSRPYETTEPNG